jgi:hypothetical protein
MYRLSTLAALTFLYMWPAPGLQAQAPDPAPAWLAADTAAKVATLSLDVSAPPGAPSALINGYRSGGVQIVVPLNWTVTWHWQSSDSTAPHSLVLMAEREKLPTEGGRPALDNAMTRMVTGGLKAGQKDAPPSSRIRQAGIGCCAGCPATRSRGNGSDSGLTRMQGFRRSRQSVNGEQ